MIERYQRCSSFQFYIKPQPLYECVPSCFVVPHSNSTSNHNVEETTLRSPQLFLIPILHQTTTDNRVLSLHSGCSSFQFYIKPQLSPAIPRKAFCCSSFQFYIKPQPLYECVPSCFVVPHSNSTSNHNVEETTLRSPQLFLIPILHQTTTDNRVLSLHSGCSSFQFYIKPQLSPAIPRKAFCCSSFQFYIKPQRSPALPEFPPGCSSFQFYIKPQHGRPLMEVDGVVPHSNSTSNHNTTGTRITIPQLFLIPILHQTTTSRPAKFSSLFVVSHSNSTSNHNILTVIKSALSLFLIPILHQTTTRRLRSGPPIGCFSFQFYIKPQRDFPAFCNLLSCFSFQFYIKPQLYRSLDNIPSVVSHSNSTSNHNLAHGSNSYSARYTYDTDA